MSKIGSREARDKFSDLLTQAAFGKERIVLTRNGRELAAIVPIEDLQMIEEIEDRIDIAGADRIMARSPKLLDWNSVKAGLAGAPEKLPGEKRKKRPRGGGRKRLS